MSINAPGHVTSYLRAQLRFSAFEFDHKKAFDGIFDQVQFTNNLLRAQQLGFTDRNVFQVLPSLLFFCLGAYVVYKLVKLLFMFLSCRSLPPMMGLLNTKVLFRTTVIVGLMVFFAHGLLGGLLNLENCKGNLDLKGFNTADWVAVVLGYILYFACLVLPVGVFWILDERYQLRRACPEQQREHKRKYGPLYDGTKICLPAHLQFNFLCLLRRYLFILMVYQLQGAAHTWF